MPQYNSDSTDTIEEIFSLEGDALRRAGYLEPDLSDAPEGFQPPTKPVGEVVMKVATKQEVDLK